MAEINRLNARMVATLTKPGRYVDGQGLHLRVTDRQRTWVFMFAFEGKQREISLGPVSRTSLAEARRKAEIARRKVADGIHPGADKKQEAAKTTPTFGEVADEYLASLSPSWKNDKHRDQWHMTLGRTRDDVGDLTGKGYCLSLADKAVDAITVDDVLAELKPIWSTKAETASRIRGRIEAVLDAAKARGLRSGENPAAWRGNLALLLPKRQKSRTVQHHAAMDYHEVPAFVARLRQAGSCSGDDRKRVRVPEVCNWHAFGGACQRLAAVSSLGVYLGLFAAALAAATILPLQSEAVLVGLLLADYTPWLLIAVATVGNVAGSSINWALGRGIERYRDRRWFPVTPVQLARAQAWYGRYGKWSLLLSWAPIIGDPLTLVAGVMRESFAVFLLLVTIAKLARYLALAWATLALV